jgi:hypothetical protein
MANEAIVFFGLVCIAWALVTSVYHAVRTKTFGFRHIRAKHLIVFPMAALFVYGLISFPDGPLRVCAEHGFCGKQGQPHTLSDYHRYVVWEWAMLIVWPAGMLLLFLLLRRDKDSE